MRRGPPPQPECSDHTPCPDGYAERAEWAEEMAKTHRCVRCPRCGLFAVWVPGPRPLLVGESNPYSSDPDDALLPYPSQSAGARLCRDILGMTREAYLAAFDRCNLVRGQKWSVPVARAEARRISVERRGGVCVLLGAKVAAAFGVPTSPFAVYDDPGASATRLVVLPHPSGLCRVWDEDGAMQRARDFVLPLVGAP